ncbi:unnamed protein product [Aphanomyces euteiches]|uniref:Uncharacterized protein n=1 Tax=Aphanomyces euteiches TaxID=100861 RepID=A0A6G0WF55_9STRA|nr:hypothetical protein Ae201684_015626 [Aphanomyces euteiches]KAH9094181.1 hypothetical protein Ae201684P_016793 [Aphanomyces euteiches]KAH9132821.1 hypothetical protein AeRB84_020885 [Aphanomyces euteiches]
MDVLRRFQPDDFAISLAVLLLSDAHVAITTDSLHGALTAASVSVSPFVVTLFANAIDSGLEIDKTLPGHSPGSAVPPTALPNDNARPRLRYTLDVCDCCEIANFDCDVLFGGDDY